MSFTETVKALAASTKFNVVAMCRETGLSQRWYYDFLAGAADRNVSASKLEVLDKYLQSLNSSRPGKGRVTSPGPRSRARAAAPIRANSRTD